MEKVQLERFFLNKCTHPERLYVIEWMLDASNDASLKNWMQDHWDLLSFYDTGEKPDVDRIWNNLQQSIRFEYAEAVHDIKQKPHKSKIARLPFFLSAAAILIILLSSLIIWNNKRELQGNENVAAATIGFLKRENLGKSPQKFIFKEGSSVNLMPGAVIHYPSSFSNDKREVFFSGEAFFDVVKNPEQPFIVYTGNLVTKVLGTRFRVKAPASASDVEISVLTGKVLVYEKGHSHEKISNHSVILTPNHKTVFSKVKNEFQTFLVEKPQPVNEANTEDVISYVTNEFNFKEVFIRDVILSIKKFYGIEVIAEREALNNCVFTGNVSDLSLYEKLDVICESIGATYQVAGTKILIKGPGCK